MADVFESFWHVDGRIFRSLRDLLVPGRIARAYRGGHPRALHPAVAAVVVLSVITFFIVAAGITDRLALALAMMLSFVGKA